MRPNFSSVLSAGLLLAAAPSVFSQTKPAVTLGELSASFETLAQRVRPSVVQIFSTGYASGEEADELQHREFVVETAQHRLRRHSL